MRALTDFFTTDYGLLSAGSIAFMLVMLVYLFNYVRRHVAMDEAAERARLVSAKKA